MDGFVKKFILLTIFTQMALHAMNDGALSSALIPSLYRFSTTNHNEIIKKTRYHATKRRLPRLKSIAHPHLYEFSLTTPPIIQCMVKHGMSLLHITTPPLLFTSKSFITHFAASAYAMPSSRGLINPYIQQFFSPFDRAIIKKFDDHFLEKYASLWFAEELFSQPYGVRKLIILHELYHLVQLNPITHKTQLVEPERYSSIEHEADAQALRHCHCYDCAQEFIAIFVENAQTAEHLSYEQALALSTAIPPTQLCAYHRLLNERKTIDTCYSNAILLSLGNDIEERIALGELEP